MDIKLAVSAAVLLGLAWILGVALKRMVSPDGTKVPDAGRIDSFSINRYAPLGRLFLDEDVEFLRTQSGYRPGMENSLRAMRRKICRAYLRNLARDFQALHGAARRLSLHAPAGHEDMAVDLMKQSLGFWTCYSFVRVRLALDAAIPQGAGIGTGTLVEAARRMQQQLLALTAMPSADAVAA